MRFYSVQLKKNVEVNDKDVTFTTIKGKKFARAEVMKDGKRLKLFRIVAK